MWFCVVCVSLMIVLMLCLSCVWDVVRIVFVFVRFCCVFSVCEWVVL